MAEIAKPPAAIAGIRLRSQPSAVAERVGKTAIATTISAAAADLTVFEFIGSTYSNAVKILANEWI